ncbi:MAG: kinase [Bacteroidetes bacterium]|nr:kinase [Bacteroidota bacterium]
MIAIFGKTVNPKNLVYIDEMLAQLRQLGLKYIVDEAYAKLLHDNNLNIHADTYKTFDEVRTQTEVLFSLGGDGTILEAITSIQHTETPILGINFGRLGFLANVGKDQIHQAIDVVAKGKYLIDKRSLLELHCNEPIFRDFPYALNEMTVQRKDQSSMITVHTYLNGELLNDYWADGLIISTPTGSTGYSLSCGGPIIYPTSGNFVLTPIAPHNLNVRPIIVSDDVVLSFEVTGRGNSFLCTLDSRFASIDSSFELAVKKASFGVRLVRLTDMNFISSLKNKLNWGMDQRN